MKHLILVRHGETVWHAENRYAGSSDIALTDRGIQQAMDLARWAGTAGLSAIWSSPLSRARLTAQPACDATGFPLQIHEHLRELHFGRGEGMTDLEMKSAFPEQRDAFLADPAKNFLPGGEPPQMAVARAEVALHEIAAKLADKQRALVVAHNTIIRLLLCRVLEIPLRKYRSTFPVLHNVTCTELGLRGDNLTLQTFNAPIVHTPEGTR